MARDNEKQDNDRNCAGEWQKKYCVDLCQSLECSNSPSGVCIGVDGKPACQEEECCCCEEVRGDWKNLIDGKPNWMCDRSGDSIFNPTCRINKENPGGEFGPNFLTQKDCNAKCS